MQSLQFISMQTSVHANIAHLLLIRLEVKKKIDDELHQPLLHNCTSETGSESPKNVLVSRATIKQQFLLQVYHLFIFVTVSFLGSSHTQLGRLLRGLPTQRHQLLLVEPHYGHYKIADGQFYLRANHSQFQIRLLITWNISEK